MPITEGVVTQYQLELPHYWTALNQESPRQISERQRFTAYLKDPSLVVIGAPKGDREKRYEDLKRRFPNDSEYMIATQLHQQDQIRHQAAKAEQQRMSEEHVARLRRERQAREKATDLPVVAGADENQAGTALSLRTRRWLAEQNPDALKQFDRVLQTALEVETFDRRTWFNFGEAEAKWKAKDEIERERLKLRYAETEALRKERAMRNALKMESTRKRYAEELNNLSEKLTATPRDCPAQLRQQRAHSNSRDLEVEERLRNLERAADVRSAEMRESLREKENHHAKVLAQKRLEADALKARKEEERIQKGKKRDALAEEDSRTIAARRERKEKAVQQNIDELHKLRQLSARRHVAKRDQVFHASLQQIESRLATGEQRIQQIKSKLACADENKARALSARSLALRTSPLRSADRYQASEERSIRSSTLSHRVGSVSPLAPQSEAPEALSTVGGDQIVLTAPDHQESDAGGLSNSHTNVTEKRDDTASTKWDLYDSFLRIKAEQLERSEERRSQSARTRAEHATAAKNRFNQIAVHRQLVLEKFHQHQQQLLLDRMAADAAEKERDSEKVEKPLLVLNEAKERPLVHATKGEEREAQRFSPSHEAVRVPHPPAKSDATLVPRRPLATEEKFQGIRKRIEARDNERRCHGEQLRQEIEAKTAAAESRKSRWLGRKIERTALVSGERKH